MIGLLRASVASALLVSGVLVAGGTGCSRWGGNGPYDPSLDEQAVPGPVDVLTLPAPTFPNKAVPSGTVWTRESVHPIEWDVPKDLGKLDDTVSIEASFDSGKTWVLVEEALLAEQLYRWTVPPQGPQQGRLRVSYHLTDKGGNMMPLRRLETSDASFAPSQKKKYTWQRVANDAPFGPRDGSGGLVFNGKMWLIGGWNGEMFPLVSSNDVWSSVDGATWVLEKPNTYLNLDTFDFAKDWEGRHFAGYQIYDNKMWILGGDPVQGRYQTDVWSSTDGRQWTRRDIHTTTPRRYLVTDPKSAYYGQILLDEAARPVDEAQYGHRTAHITGVLNNKLFLMGGQRIVQFVDPDWPGAPAKVFNDIWSSTDGASWTQVQTAGPIWSPRGYVSETVEHQGRMWMIGGGLSDDPTVGRMEREYYNDVWSTADGVKWEPVPDQPPFSPRFWHNVKSYDGRLWVINGYDGNTLGRGRMADNLRDVWYSSDGKNWYDASPPESFAPRHAGTAWVFKNELFVGSGNAMDTDPANPSKGKWFADMWKMTPSP